jgi:hypothetical protein
LGNYAGRWHGECTLGPLEEFLAEAGVRQIYGVSGDSLNGITDGTQKLLGWFGGYGLNQEANPSGKIGGVTWHET